MTRKAELSTALVAFLSSKPCGPIACLGNHRWTRSNRHRPQQRCRPEWTCAHCKTSNLVESRHVCRWDQHRLPRLELGTPESSGMSSVIDKEKSLQRSYAYNGVHTHTAFDTSKYVKTIIVTEVFTYFRGQSTHGTAGPVHCAPGCHHES